jgi:hypothetical protein
VIAGLRRWAAFIRLVHGRGPLIVNRIRPADAGSFPGETL